MLSKQTKNVDEDWMKMTLMLKMLIVAKVFTKMNQEKKK